MPEKERTYTYRSGEKVILEKEPDQFVVRALPEELSALGIADAEQMSSASSRVRVRGTELEPLMSRSRHVAPTHHAYTVADSGEEFLITDRVFVTFKEVLPTTDVDDFAGRYGLVLLEKYSDRDYLFQLTDHTGMNPVKLVVKLVEDEPLVEAADHDLNQRMDTYEFQLPTDPHFMRQWHLASGLFDPLFDERATARCDEAWKLLSNFGDPGVVVGVTDDGCKLDHPDFDSPGKFAAWGYLQGRNLITNLDIGADPDDMYQAGSNHGTSCAGVIAGEADGVLIVGAAPASRLLPIKWESSGPILFISDSKLLTVLDFVADRVDVLSNSWGSAPRTTWTPLVVRRIRELAESGGRRGRGVLFLWAAGNENCPIQHTAEIDVPYTNGWEKIGGSWTWVGVRTARTFHNDLADVPGVMHVAAICSPARRSHYSNYGPGIDVAAPSSNSHAYFRLSVPGLGITTATGELGGVTTGFGGTSSATPLVAGIAALVISANPNLSALEAASILKQTASKDLDMTGYVRTPPASFDPDPTWDVSPIVPFDRGDFSSNGNADGSWSPWFGHGRVDALNAVTEALVRKAPAGDETIHKQSAPNLDIPDNHSTGVRDTITISEEFHISSIQVTIDIRHTFIGDLRLSLISPAGSAVVLHNRSGGGANNIRQTYDLQSTPALSILLEQPVQGDWTLHIQDLATHDNGQLRSWELEVEGLTSRIVLLEESPGVSIPDDDPAGIERQIETNNDGRVGKAEVSVDISHTYIGDLVVSLISPAGTTVPLHERAGRWSDNITTTYTPATIPALDGVRGEPIQGAWRLRVADLAGLDRGKLNRWGIRLLRES